MRKWQNLAAPDDPNSWYDVDGFWPTSRGTYETADAATVSALTATGCTDAIYAWRAKTTATSGAQPHYVIDSTDIWQYDGASVTPLTKRTGGVSFAAAPRFQFAQYGSITLAVLGSTRYGYSGGLGGAATIKATSVTGNFSALAGAPQGETICIESNAVGIFNTDAANDGWAFSDVGDYTNWTTGEAASGRIFFPAGPIYAAVSLAGAIYAFKFGSIHRFRYVGGLVKWAVEKVWEGTGCSAYGGACAGATGILFQGYSLSDAGNPTTPYYWYDGANPPIQTNPLTEIPAGTIIYDPIKNRFSVSASAAVYYFDPVTMAWGRSSAPYSGAPYAIPVVGSYESSGGTSLTPTAWAKTATNTLSIWSPLNAVAGTSYLQTAMFGRTDRKTQFARATPLHRKRLSLGTPSVALSLTTFREREDTGAQTTTAVTESPFRKRFDFNVTDNYAKFKFTYTDLDVEVDDVMVKSQDAGED